jgi:hypothetical protein
MSLRRTLPLALACGLLGACGPLLLLDLDDYEARVAVAPAADGLSPVACTSHATCIAENADKPAACVAGTCVNVDLDLCPYVLPSIDVLKKNDALLVASFLPVKGSSPLAQPQALAYGLALKQLADANDLALNRRPIAMLVCAADSTAVENAKRHVAEDLRVPAVIAGFDDVGLAKWVQDYATKKKVFTLNPGVATDELKFGETGGLVWSLLGTPQEVAFAYRPLLLRTEKYVHARRGDTQNPQPIKVALLTADTTTEEAVAEVLQRGPQARSVEPANPKDFALVFNAQSTEANEVGGKFLSVRVGAVEKGETPDYTGIQTKLKAFNPDVVIALTREEVAEIVKRYESETTGRPIWLLSYRNHREPLLLEYLANNTNELSSEKLERFLGIQYAGTSGPRREDWLGRMRDAYPKAKESDYESAENYYDAVYWLAYGLAGIGQEKIPSEIPTTGASFRDGVRTLLAGPEVYAGDRATVNDAFRVIRERNEVTFVGALGPPDIAQKYGTWNSVGAVYCYEETVTTGDGGVRVRAISPRFNELRYERVATGPGTLAGDFNCFLGPPQF